MNNINYTGWKTTYKIKVSIDVGADLFKTITYSQTIFYSVFPFHCTPGSKTRIGSEIYNISKVIHMAGSLKNETLVELESIMFGKNIYGPDDEQYMLDFTGYCNDLEKDGWVKE